MRVLTAIRSLQTAVPLGVCRSSGSRVRLPTRTTRLMLAMLLFLLLRTCVRSVAGGPDGGPIAALAALGPLRALFARGRRCARPRAFDPADGEVAHHAVGDPQHAR